MNKLLVVLCICCFPFIMLAQEELLDEGELVQQDEELTNGMDGKIARHEFGLNVNNFIDRFISFNDLIIDDPNAYLLTYKLLLNHKRAIRFGLNGNYFTIESEDSAGNNSISPTTSYDIDARIGYYMNRRINNRWSTYLSLDAIYGYSHSENSFDFGFTNSRLIFEDKVSTLGGGPSIGIQFFINSKVSLSTELNIYYKYWETQSSEEFSDNSGPDSKETQKSSSASIATPASLYLNFRF